VAVCNFLNFLIISFLISRCLNPVLQSMLLCGWNWISY